MADERQIVCLRCGARPQDLAEYLVSSEEYGCTPEEYVVQQEGTYDISSRTFLCTRCYVAVGTPLKKDIPYPRQ